MKTKMKVAQISKPGGDFELVERDIPEPGPGQVRIKVEACGVCHSDMLVKEGYWPGLQYPRVPGHEIAGRIDALGSGVTAWKTGDRVGVGWHGGHDFVCDECRRGDFAMCANRKVTGIDYDGGYAEYVIAPAEALAAIPNQVPAEEAGPFMCAGVTVFNALRNSGARPGDLVAVQGIGGLGHLGVQYARKMGFENRCARTGRRQRTARQTTRRTSLHRFGRCRHGGGNAKARRRTGDSGDGPEREGDLRCGQRIGHKWQSPNSGCAERSAHRRRVPVDNGPPTSLGLVFRDRPGLARYFEIQRLERRPSNDREISS